MAAEGNGDLPVPDLRTMEELCQPSLNGRGGPIAPISIQATNFGLKNGMIQQVQNSCQFHGLPSDDANKHLDEFLHVTQSIKVNGVTDDALRASHGQNPPPSYQAWAYQAPGYQALVHQPQIHQPQVVTTNEFTNFKKANDAILKNMQTNVTSLTNSNRVPKNMFAQFMKMNTASSSGSRTLPGNTITNPKEEMKGITTRSGTAYQGPTIPTTSFSLPLVVERETGATKDMVYPTNNGSTKDVQPPVVQTESSILNSEPVVALIIEPVVASVSAPKPNQRPSIQYPSRLHDQKLCDKANDQREKFFQIFKDLNFNISFADALIMMPKFGPTIKTLLTNKDKLSELARTSLNEHCSASYVDTEGDILLLEAFLNDDPSLPPQNQGNYFPQVQKELKIYEAESDKSSIDELPEVKLKDLPPHLEYAFLEGDDKLPVIIAKDLSVEEKTANFVLTKFSWRMTSNQRFNIREGSILKSMMSSKMRMETSTTVFSMVSRVIFKFPLIQKIKKRPQSLVYTERLPIVACLLGYAMHWARSRGDKSHFIIKEGIILGHKISKNGIEVDKARVDVIAKLPHSITVKGICSFLGHVVFYRRFIKDFSKIAQLMTRLLEKDTSFFFFKECVEAFQTLKRKLTEVSILITPDWDLPFELMCDASDFAVGEVLGFGTLVPSSVFEERTSAMTSLQRSCLLGENRASWSDKIDDALWAFQTAYKTPIECTPYKLVYKKTCHIPIELEHKAYWALKHANFDLQTEGDHRKVQLNELNELRDQAYENSLIYKEKTNMLHDSKIKDRVFNIGDRVLLFNSRLKIFSCKLKSYWFGPFTITHVFSYGTFELSQTDGPNLKVNGHRLKHYFGEDIPKMVVLDLQTFPKDQRIWRLGQAKRP
nr:reverse transcriptase domain-containing protein [Tanacetum cinerariifolium]